MEYDFGATVPLAVNVFAADGVTSANADTITLTITLPDGTTTTPTVTNPPTVTGSYVYLYTQPPQAGRYVVYWDAGGANTSAYATAFVVRPANWPRYADADDVATRWRPLSTSETVIANTLCQDAVALIRSRFPGIDSQVSSGQVDPQNLTIVIAGMVRRAMTAPPTGVTSQSETAGPFSHSQTFANPLGNVFLTAADLTLIIGYQPAGQTNTYGNTTTRCGYGPLLIEPGV